MRVAGHRWLTAAALLVVLAVAAPARGAEVLAPIGAWCWFADPRAIVHDGRAIFGWVADDGSIMVGDDRGTRFNLHPQLERDDHDNPAFHVREDGRLTAFWTAHGGETLYYRVTTGADIEAWGPRRTLPVPDPGGGTSRYTYPNPVRVGETLYLFWSGTGGAATYATSPDDGETWSTAERLFDPTTTFVRYVKYRRSGDEIHFAWTLAHPRALESGVRHAVIRGTSIERQDGTPIGSLGTPMDPNAGDLVYEPTTQGGAWIHDLDVVDGRPQLAYATFPTLGEHLYRVARWSPDEGWLDEPIVSAGPAFPLTAEEPHYSGGISFDRARPGSVYLSRRVARAWEIEHWTRSGGVWSGVPITSGSATRNVRPFPVGDRVAWMRGEYPHFLTFRTALVWNGVRAAVPTAPPVGTRPAPSGAPPPARPHVTVRCATALRQWRVTRRPAALRRYWRCRVRAGSCRDALRAWRRHHSGPALRAWRRSCAPRPAPSPRPIRRRSER